MAKKYAEIGARECYSGMPRVNRKELWQQSLLAGTKSKIEKNANILQLLFKKEETLFPVHPLRESSFLDACQQQEQKSLVTFDITNDLTNLAVKSHHVASSSYLSFWS